MAFVLYSCETLCYDFPKWSGHKSEDGELKLCLLRQIWNYMYVYRPLSVMCYTEFGSVVTAL